GEGLITVGTLAVIYAARPDLLRAGAERSPGGVLLWVAGLAIAAALAIISPLASAHPDGLEWIAEQQGFLTTAKEPIYNIIPDYVFPGVTNEALATILAGITGTLIVFAVALIVAYTRRSRQTA
ncbi:MAG: PDGLE domain-containing protein, partial [Anaerolineales bacterium]